MKRGDKKLIYILFFNLLFASNIASSLSAMFKGGLEFAQPDAEDFAIKTYKDINKQIYKPENDNEQPNSETGNDLPTSEIDEMDSNEDVEESFLNVPISPIPEIITLDYLKTNITDFHTGIKTCLDDHYKRSVEDQIELKLIIQDCAGTKGDVLTRYYNDIKFLIKKYLYDSIRDKLKKGYCDEDLNSCLEYYRALQLFVELNFDIASSIDANFDVLEGSMGSDKLNYLKSLSVTFISDYNELRSELRKEQEFLLNYFRLKRQQYNQEYAEYQLSKENKDEDLNQDQEEEHIYQNHTKTTPNMTHTVEENKHPVTESETGKEGGELTPDEIRYRKKISKIYEEHLYHYSDKDVKESNNNKALQGGESSIDKFVSDP